MMIYISQIVSWMICIDRSLSKVETMDSSKPCFFCFISRCSPKAITHRRQCGPMTLCTSLYFTFLLFSLLLLSSSCVVRSDLIFYMSCLNCGHSIWRHLFCANSMVHFTLVNSSLFRPRNHWDVQDTFEYLTWTKVFSYSYVYVIHRCFSRFKKELFDFIRIIPSDIHSIVPTFVRDLRRGENESLWKT